MTKQPEEGSVFTRREGVRFQPPLTQLSEGARRRGLRAFEGNLDDLG